MITTPPPDFISSAEWWIRQEMKQVAGEILTIKQPCTVSKEHVLFRRFGNGHGEDWNANAYHVNIFSDPADIVKIQLGVGYGDNNENIKRKPLYDLKINKKVRELKKKSLAAYAQRELVNRFAESLKLTEESTKFSEACAKLADLVEKMYKDSKGNKTVAKEAVTICRSLNAGLEDHYQKIQSLYTTNFDYQLGTAIETWISTQVPQSTQEWEGYVVHVDNEKQQLYIELRNNEKTDDAQSPYSNDCDYTATVPLDSVEESDRDLVRAGASFYYFINTYKDVKGAVNTKTSIRFKRLGPYSKAEIAEIQKRAKENQEKHSWD